MNVNIMCPPLPTEGKVMLDYSQTWAPCDFYLPTFPSLLFQGLTSLCSRLHPDSLGFICLHGCKTQQLQFPRLHRLFVRNLTSVRLPFPSVKGWHALGANLQPWGSQGLGIRWGRVRKQEGTARRTLCPRPASCQPKG